MSVELTGSEKVQFAFERLLDMPDGWRPLVREMVARWPEAPASEIVYTLVATAAKIEATFDEDDPSRAAADRAWRLAALVGTDLYAMELVGLPRRRAADLKGYWLIDPYFRDL